MAAAVLAFVLWGLLPLFWNRLSFLDPFSIVAQRTVWSLVLLLPILIGRREGGTALRQFSRPRDLGLSLASGLLLGTNWVLYVWATLNHRILDTSLGYYLNPFFNMLFGVLWFGERHGPLRTTAIAIALAGVGLQVPALGRFPWIPLALALTFSLYAVIGKRSGIGSRIGVTLDSALLCPLAIGWLLASHGSPADAFGNTPAHAGWVIATGLATTLPLVLFGHAAHTAAAGEATLLQPFFDSSAFLWLLVSSFLSQRPSPPPLSQPPPVSKLLRQKALDAAWWPVVVCRRH